MLNTKINVPKHNFDVMGVKFHIQNGGKSPLTPGVQEFLFFNEYSHVAYQIEENNK